MSSALMKGLVRCLCAVLCYGMVFSYPSWTIWGRVAHAADAKPSGGVDGISPGSIVKAGEKPAEGTPVSKDKAVATKEPDKKHAAPPKKSSSEAKEKKKPSEAPVGADCADDKFFLGATSGSLNFFAGDSVCAQGNTNTVVQPHCWTQFFVFLGGAEANAYYVGKTPDRSPAPAVAARTLSTVNDFVPKLGDELSKSGNEEALTKVLDKMSRPDMVKNGDNRQCCLQLVDQARKVANYLYTSSTNPSRPDLKPNKAKQQQMDALIAQKQAQCESGGGGVIVGGGHVAAPPPEKKKNNGMLLAILIALGVGLLIWALTKNKNKKKSKPRPTETPPVCKGKKCGGGNTNGNSNGRPPCNTGNCGNNVGTTTAEEPPVTTTGSTYPSTGETTRGNSTGETGGDTYPNTNGDTTRGNSTGDTGTVTGSTNANTGDDTGGNNTNTTGDDSPSGGDGPGRTTSGTPRPLAPSRTLIK